MNGIRKEVTAFAQIMEEMLQQNDYKGGWSKCNPQWLLMRLQQEVEELDAELSVTPFNQENIRKEAADVANFAMMVVDVCGGLE
jgi:NTP pyrophosphatase (non-canonical NTP hydrolase)